MPKDNADPHASKAGASTLRASLQWCTVVSTYWASVQDLAYHALQRLFVKAVSMGPLPQHIAFIMDGNRRWSRANGVHVLDGHKMGFQALRRVLDLCMSLEGIYMVTVYAFAVDNFKRDKAEVDALMELAKTRLLELYDHGEVVSRYSVRVRVIGQRHLLPADVQDAVFRLEEATQHNTGAVLNICMPYSSQDEIAHAISVCSAQPAPVTCESVDTALWVSTDVPVDLLCNEQTQLQFVDQYWPMFGARDLILILLQYQRARLLGI